MRNNTLYIADEFKRIVECVSNELQSDLQAVSNDYNGVYFYQGNLTEIQTKLVQLGNTASKKRERFPMVGLLHDFPKKHGQSVGIGIKGEITVTLFIANQTEDNYDTEQRLENNFKPILYPIYQSILKHIAQSGTFQTNGVDSIEHTQVDHMFWGSDSADKSPFADKLDCLELRDLRLKIKQTYC